MLPQQSMDLLVPEQEHIFHKRFCVIVPHRTAAIEYVIVPAAPNTVPTFEYHGTMVLWYYHIFCPGSLLTRAIRGKSYLPW